MRYLNYRFWFIFLLAGTLVLNFIQALSTGIISDEAYYTLYGDNLSWGYFDHPPAVAVMTHLSSLIFSGALGIRFTGIVIHILTLLITWKVINEKAPDTKKVLLFFLIVSSFVMLTVYGFVTTPDVPLLFFTALFLFTYKKFLEDASLDIILLFGVAMAGLVYSKYQAALVIGFVVFSNLRLLKDGKFWLSAILGLMLLIPHFYWLFDHDFPTIKYQLIDRATEFKWQYIIEFIPHAFAVFNPFVFVAILYILVKYRPRDLFERALYFLIVGFILFFWASGFRGHVQPQWTVAASIPMVIILYHRILENKKLRIYVLRFFLPTLLILMVLRVLIAQNKYVASICSFEKEWPRGNLISEVAGNLPVLFHGSFQESSKYPYFTGKKAFTLSSIEGRYTQFDVWQFEKQYHNKAVFICDSIYGHSKKTSNGKISIHGFITDSLQTVNRMIVDFEKPAIQVRQGETIVMQISVHNPYPFTIDFNHKQFPVKALAVFISKGKRKFQPVRFDLPIGLVGAGSTMKRKLFFTIPKLQRDDYQLGFSLSTCLSNPLNSRLVRINVK